MAMDFLRHQPWRDRVASSHNVFYPSHNIFYRLGVRRRNDFERAIAHRAVPKMTYLPLIPILGPFRGNQLFVASNAICAEARTTFGRCHSHGETRRSRSQMSTMPPKRALTRRSSNHRSSCALTPRQSHVRVPHVAAQFCKMCFSRVSSVHAKRHQDSLPMPHGTTIGRRVQLGKSGFETLRLLEAYRLPTGARKDTERRESLLHKASPFVELVRALQVHIPDEYASTNARGGLAERISKARTASKSKSLVVLRKPPARKSGRNKSTTIA